MKEIKKLSKVTYRLGENWKDRNERVQQLRHLNKEVEISPLRNVIAQAKTEEKIAARILKLQADVDSTIGRNQSQTMLPSVKSVAFSTPPKRSEPTVPLL